MPNFKLIFRIFLLLILYPLALKANGPELVLQTGHTSAGEINSVVFHPDGKMIASAGADQTIKLWDVSSGMLIRTFTGHKGRILDISFSSSGDTLASSGIDRTIRLWNTNSGNKIAAFRDDDFYPSSAYIHPHSRIVFSAGSSGDEGNIKIWDIVTGNAIFKLRRYNPVDELCFAADGKTFATAENSNEINIWGIEFDKPEPKSGLKTGDEVITSIDMTPDGKLLAAKDEDNSITLFDVEKSRIINEFEGYSEDIKISDDGRTLATTEDDMKSIRIINLASGKTERLFRGHNTEVISFDFSPDGRYLASGSAGGMIKIWDIQHGTLFKNLTGEHLSIGSMDVSKNGKYLAYTVNDEKEGPGIALFNLDAGILADFIKPDMISISSIKFSSKSDKLAIGGYGFRGKSFYIYDIENYEISRWKTISPKISLIEFIPDDDLIFYTNEDTLHMQDFHSEIMKKSISADDGSDISSMNISGNGNIICFGTGSGGIYLFDREKNTTQRSPASEDTEVIATGFSSTGDTLIAVHENGIVELLKRNDLERIDLLTNEHWGHKISAVSFDPESNRLFTGAWDNNINIWDISEGMIPEFTFKNAHINIISALILIKGKNILVSGGTGGLVKFWDIEKKKNLLNLFAKAADEWAIVSPDGYFDGSKKGFDNLHWVKGNEPLALETYFDDYFRPYLLDITVNKKMEDSRLFREGAIAGEALPPGVDILEPAFDTVKTNSKVLFVKLIKHTYPIEKLLVYLNGKLIVTDDKFKNNMDSVLRKYKVNLVPGNNIIKFVALDKKRKSSNPKIVNVVNLEKVISRNLYLLATGISDYGKYPLNLNYAGKDAKTIIQFIEESNYYYDSVYVYPLYDSEATKEKIKENFEKIITRAKPEDIFVFYFAGHGISKYSKDSCDLDFYFWLYDKTNQYDEGNPGFALSAVEAGQLISKIKANKQLLIIDACQSSAVIDNMFWQMKEKMLRNRNFAKMSNLYGLNILTSSVSSRPAYENNSIEHGVFTYVLLEGMKGRASHDDEYITVGELKIFLDKELPAVCRKYNLTQYPYGRLDGSDFTILKVGK